MVRSIVSSVAVCLTTIGPPPPPRMPPPPPPPVVGAGAAAASGVHVPEKSGFACAKAIVATDSTAAAITPVRANFMLLLLVMKATYPTPRFASPSDRRRSLLETQSFDRV